VGRLIYPALFVYAAGLNYRMNSKEATNDAQDLALEHRTPMDHPVRWMRRER
jgi:hypothetical protein